MRAISLISRMIFPFNWYCHSDGHRLLFSFYRRVAMKKCSSCGEEKEASEYGIRMRSADGLSASCTVCLKKRDKARYERDKPKRLALQKAYSQTAGGKEAHRRAALKWVQENKVKRACHCIFNNALRDGKIKISPCEVCGKKAHAHHSDYDRPLDVIWLCPKHHKEAHLMIKE